MLTERKVIIYVRNNLATRHTVNNITHTLTKIHFINLSWRSCTSSRITFYRGKFNCRFLFWLINFIDYLTYLCFTILFTVALFPFGNTIKNHSISFINCSCGLYREFLLKNIQAYFRFIPPC